MINKYKQQTYILSNTKKSMCFAQSKKQHLISKKINHQKEFVLNKRKKCEWIIKEELERGIYGIVYILCCVNVRDYILKVIEFKNDILLKYNHNDFKNEIELQSKASEHTIAPIIYSAWIKNNKGYIIMDRIIQDDKTILSNKQLNSEFNLQLYKAIEKLHKNSIIHMDLRDNNILLMKNKVYIIDYGISKKSNKSIYQLYDWGMAITNIFNKTFANFKLENMPEPILFKTKILKLIEDMLKNKELNSVIDKEQQLLYLTYFFWFDRLMKDEIVKKFGKSITEILENVWYS